MEFKCNRLYYFLSKRFRHRFSILSLGAVGMILLSFFIGSTNLLFFIWPPILLVICMAEDMLLKPKKFEIADNYVSLKLSIKVPREVVIKRGISNYKTKRVNAKIHNIDVIQYHATPFEKSNRVGRIIIYGRVVARDFCNDYVAAEHLPSSVEIFGVKDFESAVSSLKSAFPDATIDEL